MSERCAKCGGLLGYHSRVCPTHPDGVTSDTPPRVAEAGLLVVKWKYNEGNDNEENEMIKYISPTGETLYENEVEDLFNATLDDAEWPVVAGMELAPSRVLRAVDPTAYRTLLLQWMDATGYDEVGVAQ